MWAYLLVLLLLFSVAGGSGFPVLAETEHIEDVSTEAENMETAEMEAGETEAEEKAGKQDGQAEEQQQGDSGSDENTGKDTGEKDPDENTETVAPGENNEAENPETTEKGQKAGNLEAGSEADDAEVMETVLPEEELVPEELQREIMAAEPVVLDLATVKPEAPSLARRKYAERNPDGTYDLTLEFTGKADTDSNARKLDVLLIVDRSGSMTYSMGGSKETNYKNSRWYNAKLAIQQLIDTLEQNDGLDVRYSIVTYSGSEDDGTWNDASIAVEWNEAKNFKISGNLTNPQDQYSVGGGKLDYKPSGGTNYQAGSVRERNNWQKPVQTRKRQYCFCRMENQRFIIIVTEILWEPEMKMQMKIGGEISITGAAVPAPPIPRQTK